MLLQGLPCLHQPSAPECTGGVFDLVKQWIGQKSLHLLDVVENFPQDELHNLLLKPIPAPKL